MKFTTIYSMDATIKVIYIVVGNVFHNSTLSNQTSLIRQNCKIHKFRLTVHC